MAYVAMHAAMFTFLSFLAFTVGVGLTWVLFWLFGFCGSTYRDKGIYHMQYAGVFRAVLRVGQVYAPVLLCLVFAYASLMNLWKAHAPRAAKRRAFILSQKTKVEWFMALLYVILMHGAFKYFYDIWPEYWTEEYIALVFEKEINETFYVFLYTFAQLFFTAVVVSYLDRFDYDDEDDPPKPNKARATRAARRGRI